MPKKEEPIKIIRPVTKIKKQRSLQHAFLTAAMLLCVIDRDDKKDPRPHVTVSVQNKQLEVLMDTGACVSVMSEQVFDSLPSHEFFEDKEIAAFTSGGLKDDVPEPDEGHAAVMTPSDKTDFIGNLLIQTDNSEAKKKYEELCYKFHDVFSKSSDDLGRCSFISHEIKLKPDRSDPVHIKQFPIPMAHREVIHDWVDKLLAQGAIELSRSAYNSPIFCVPKKDSNKLRVVQDFREVNMASLPDRYTIRDARECIDEIGQEESKVFSAIDLTSGFWQQNLHEDSRGYTAFTIPGKGGSKYQWTVNPMGLQGAPASFARLIDFIFRGLPHVLAYIDDILVHTKTDDDQIVALEKVFLRMRKYGLKLNQKKSVFGARQVEYLGYRISG